MSTTTTEQVFTQTVDHNAAPVTPAAVSRQLNVTESGSRISLITARSRGPSSITRPAVPTSRAPTCRSSGRDRRTGTVVIVSALLNTHEAAAHLRVSVQSVKAWRAGGYDGFADL